MNSRTRRPTLKTCANPTCGQTFPYRSNRKYCSSRCAAIAGGLYGRAELKNGNLRACHDCGKPTPNYRCTKCLGKWRREHGVGVNPDSVVDFDDFRGGMVL